MATVLRHLMAIFLLVQTVHGEACDDAPYMPTASGTEGWMAPYDLSISNANSTIFIDKPATDPQWSKLRVMPLLEPVTFKQWEQIEGVWVQSNTTIQEPVVVVTWSFANIPNSNSINELGNSLVNRRILQRYVTSQDPLNGNSTLWFTKHGNAGDYLDEVNLNRSCLNLSLNDQACDEAIAWGVPTVGVPFGFQKTSSDQPYENVLGAWWREYILIGIADRRAFVRPSYNPTVAEDSAAWMTRDGVPLWSHDRQQYWYAPVGTDEAMAQQAAINDPSGDSRYQFKAYNLNQSMTTDFEGWLKAWQDDSWISADQPDNCYVNGFPYTSIGLTGNWQYASAGSVLDQRFLSLSEFILKADAPIWWFGRRAGTQYLGKAQQSLGQVSWCDSCWGDLDMSGAIDAGDLLMVLEAWGTRNPCMDLSFEYDDPECASSQQMRSVDVMDMLWILEQWGPCDGWPDSLQTLRPPDCF